MLTPEPGRSRSNAPGRGELGPENPKAIAGELDRALTEAEAEAAREEVKLERRHSILMGYFREERMRQATNRFQMALDEDYFDGLQWDEEEILALANRNQAALVYQAIKPMVLWVLGTEKRTRTDYKVLARREEEDEDAQIKTKTLKYVDDVNMAQFARSQAFKEAIVSGLGWLEDGASNNPGELPVYGGAESWKNILRDSYGVDPFTKDWRYIFRFRDLDEDVAKAMFPEFASHIEVMASDERKGTGEEEGWYLGERGDGLDYKNPAKTYVGRRQFVDISATQATSRRRLRIIEAWYRVPEQCFVCKGTMFDGETFDPNKPDMKAAYEQGAIMLVNQVQMKMRVAFMTERRILQDQPSPYKHNEFPFTPVWCYRRGRDGEPYGIVRELRDPQDALNKHFSKIGWLLASNQIKGHVSASNDWPSIRRAVDKPNGSVIFDGDPAAAANVEINRHQAEIGPHVELAKVNMTMMRENYGLNMDTLGQVSNATSGKAILARQEQGTVQTEPIFDMLRLARQLQGRKRLSLCEQYLVDERVIRAQAKGRGNWEYLAINKPEFVEGEWRFKNDITASQADFVIDEQDYRASIKQAMAESMADMIAKMPPDIAFRFMDLWIELVDIPNKQEYLERVRKLNGMGPEDDPRVLEAQQQAEQQVAEVTQQAEQVIGQAQKQAQGLAEENQRLKAAAQQKDLKLADRTEERQMQRQENAAARAERLAAIEAERIAGAQPEAKPTGKGSKGKERLDALQKQVQDQLADIAKAVEQARQENAEQDREEMAAMAREAALAVLGAMPKPAGGDINVDFKLDGNGNIVGATLKRKGEA